MQEGSLLHELFEEYRKKQFRLFSMSDKQDEAMLNWQRSSTSMDIFNWMTYRIDNIVNGED